MHNALALSVIGLILELNCSSNPRNSGTGDRHRTEMSATLSPSVDACNGKAFGHSQGHSALGQEEPFSARRLSCREGSALAVQPEFGRLSQKVEAALQPSNRKWPIRVIFLR